VRVIPNSRNTVPGQVDFTVDFRHPEHDVLVKMEELLRTKCSKIEQRTGVKIEVDHISYSPPIQFDPQCVTAVENSCKSLGYSYRRMISGAGHDACYISQVAPTSMIFVPCANGISHSEAESAEPEDLTAGCNVLLQAALSFAG
jgi:N-carbamoyl-L-amino-acid hydrolase